MLPAGDASSPRRRRASSGHACNHLSANPNLIPPPSCCLCALHAAAQNYAVLCRPGHRSPSSAADSRQQRPPSAPLLRHPPRAARPDGAGRSTRPPSPPNHPLSSCAPVSLYFRRPRGDLKPGRPDPRLAGRDPPANLDSHLSVCSVPDGIWVGDFFFFTSSLPTGSSELPTRLPRARVARRRAGRSRRPHLTLWPRPVAASPVFAFLMWMWPALTAPSAAQPCGGQRVSAG